jgi:myo-inositol 2-dehydrogenase / D-chiro-inositol 1-dehydrogenase
MTDRNIRIGLLGYGAFGKCHAQAIAEAEGAELAAIAEVSTGGIVEAKADYPNAEIFTNYADLIDRCALDVVNIVLPNYLHFDAAKRALERGCHLLLEKPMTLAVDDCKTLIDIAEQQDRILAIGHQFRLSPLWGRVKQLIDEGFVGEPRYVLVELSRHPYFPGADGWRWDIDRVGDWILEEPIHFFDLARWYLSSAGEPRSVYALASSGQNNQQLQDNLSALIRYANGAYANVTQTLSAFEHHQTVKVTGAKGAIAASWSGKQGHSLEPSFTLKTYDGETIREIEIDQTPGELYELRTQIKTMVNAAPTGQCSLPNGHDGQWAVALCAAAAESAREGKEVDLPQP